MMGENRWVTCPDEVKAAARTAAAEMIAVVESFPPGVALAVTLELCFDEEPGGILPMIGEALASTRTDRVERLAAGLTFDVFTGHALELAEQLSNTTEPWRTFRRAIGDVWECWQRVEPGRRNWHEWRKAKQRRHP